MHYFRRSRSGQVHSFMAALTCLCSVETNFTREGPSPKSFVCNLTDSGRHVTNVHSRSVGRVGENPGNEVVINSPSDFGMLLLKKIPRSNNIVSK